MCCSLLFSPSLYLMAEGAENTRQTVQVWGGYCVLGEQIKEGLHTPRFPKDVGRGGGEGGGGGGISM